MKKVALGLGSILLLASSSKAEFLIDFEAAIGVIQQRPKGCISYKPRQDADKIDVKNDAHFGNKTKPWVRLKLEHSIPVLPNIKLAYMPMKFDGSGVLTRDVSWGGRTYQANADFSLSVKLDRFDTTLYYNLPFVKNATNGKLGVELGLNVRTIMFDGKLSGTEKCKFAVHDAPISRLLKNLPSSKLNKSAKLSPFSSAYSFNHFGAQLSRTVSGI